MKRLSTKANQSQLCPLEIKMFSLRKIQYVNNFIFKYPLSKPSCFHTLPFAKTEKNVEKIFLI